MLNTGPTLGGSQLKTSSWLQHVPAPTGKPGGLSPGLFLRPGRAKFQNVPLESPPVTHCWLRPMRNKSLPSPKPYKRTDEGAVAINSHSSPEMALPTFRVGLPTSVHKEDAPKSIRSRKLCRRLPPTNRCLPLSIKHLVISSWCREPRSATLGLVFCSGKL